MARKTYDEVKVGNRYHAWTVKKAGERRWRRQCWICVCDCGNEGDIDEYSLKSGNSKSCGCRRHRPGPKRELAFNWRGGRHTKASGYVLVYAPSHPAAKSKKYLAEHRLIMEKKLGRYLHKDEFVHHVNGIKHDNRLENLELWSRHHPHGQRVEDLIRWAEEILIRYRDFKR